MKLTNSLNAGGSHAGTVVSIMLLAALTLAGCSTAPRTETPAVVDRAQARWDAIISGDLESAYTFYSPGFRSANSLIDFGVAERMKKVTYISADYLEHSCEESVCRVKFNVGYQVVNPVPGMGRYQSKQAIEDNWIKTGGDWWYLPKK